MSIIRNLTSKCYNDERPIHIMTQFYDGHFEYNLSKLNCKLYGMQELSILHWSLPVSKKPENIVTVPKEFNRALLDFPVDLLICNNRLNYKLSNYSLSLHVPIVIVDHLVPPSEALDDMPSLYVKAVNVACHPSLKQAKNSKVINYGVDIPEQELERDIDVLVAGKLMPSDYDVFSLLKKEFRCVFMGDNPPHSKEIYDKEYEDLFLRSKVYLNLASNTGIPYNLLKGMAAGCAIVTNKTPTLSSVLQDSALYINNKTEIVSGVQHALGNQNMSNKALDIAKTDFSMQTFQEKWSELLKELKEEIFLA